MIKNRAEFRAELEKVNRWWLTGKVAELEERKLIKRTLFSRASEELLTRRAIILTGPRRVGKTVMLFQLAAHLIEQGTPPRNILYHSLDSPILKAYSDNLLKDLLDYFLENIAREGKVFILLDEVCLFPDWYKWIKAYYDRDSRIKFILSGSSSLSLKAEANRYLRGRTIELELSPLSFREFLLLSGTKTREIDGIKGLRKLDPFKVRQLAHKVRPAFMQYLLVGAFPEWFEIRGVPRPLEKWFARLVNDIPKKAIYEDVTNIFGIRNPRLLEQIMTFTIANQAKILSYETINQVAKLDRTTLINYIEFLKTTYLIVEVLKYARSLKEQLRSKKKFLAIDQGLRNAILKDYEIKEDNIGLVIENIVGLHITLSGLNVSYHRANGEIDFIIKKGDQILPVEVKFRKKPEPSRVLFKFMAKEKASQALIITQDLFKLERVNKKEILYIPAWLFMLTDLAGL